MIHPPPLLALLYRLQDGLTLYLPVVVMGVLAMATYWLVRSTPVAPMPAPAAPAMHQPDYFMRGFAVKTYDKTGQLKSEVRGTQALHFPDTNTLEIDQITVKTHNEGILTTATASHAVTPGDGSEIRLIGRAQMVRTSPLRPDNAQTTITLTGEFLHAYVHTGRIISDKPVTLTRGADTFFADSMALDRHTLLLKGRVKGHLSSAAH